MSTRHSEAKPKNPADEMAEKRIGEKEKSEKIMTKTEIARTIIDICGNDASFCRDIRGGDPDVFLSEIADDMPEKEFLFAVDRYLASFKVWGHLYFYKKGLRTDPGFHVRRYGDSLFITQAEKRLPFSKGDEIVAIDGMAIKEAAEKFSVFFDSDPPDRQGERWENVIAHAKNVTVRSDRTFDYAVRTDAEREVGVPSCACRALGPHRFYVKFTNFFDDQDVSMVMASEEVAGAEELIVDLRDNCGGNDVEFLPLLRLFLAEDDELCGMPIFSDEDEILCTERNADGRIKIFREALAGASDELREYLLEQIGEQSQNRGKGFIPSKADEFLFPAKGTRRPESVVLLTDYGCASSAESLVEIASRMQKVTVIGRPTMGICDYSNLARFDFGEYVLHYPTSRRKAIDEGRGTRGKGILPDLYVPWTPRHLLEDVDLSVAVDWLNRRRKKKTEGK